jgi:hypothetical protein
VNLSSKALQQVEPNIAESFLDGTAIEMHSRVAVRPGRYGLL